MPRTYEVQLKSGLTKELLAGTVPTTISTGYIPAFTFMGAAVDVLAKHLEAPEVWVRQEIAGSPVGNFSMYSLRFGDITYVVEVWECLESAVLV